jgi:hypothetical protein
MNRKLKQNKMKKSADIINMKIRTGKFAGNMKHLGKSVGSSRKRNLKRMAAKANRRAGKAIS